MALPNIFSKDVTDEIISRINKLNKDTKPKWGKMSVSQMLAHCCVTYQYVYKSEKFNKPNLLMGWVLKSFVKKSVVNEIPYGHNIKTGPDFIIKGDRDFESEKQRLVEFLRRSQKDGEEYFSGKESFSFGKLNTNEWNNMFYKHMNHHLTQFGV